MRRVSLVLFLLFFATALFAQQPAQMPSPTFYYVHEEVARPSMMADYERTTKELGAMMRGANVPFYYDAFMSDDFHYYYVLPMKSMGGVDKIMQVFMSELPQKVGKEKVSDLMRRSGATMESTNEWVFIRRDDISYAPAKPRLKEEEMKAFRWEFYYVKPGMEEMVDSISNAWKAAFAAAQIGDGFTVYQAVVGGDLPVVVVVSGGKDMVDLVGQYEKSMAALGDKVPALTAKTLDATRKFEVKYARVRPDLANPMPATK